MKGSIEIEGARSRNLRGVSCTIPLGALTVISGVSGSGKSTLAFDTLYAEGQRRYVTSLSTYARQFLERLPRPDVDRIGNLPPAIAIEQRNAVTQARSTVGTATEIFDHLRLLYAKIGETRCCGERVLPGTVEVTTRRLLEDFAGRRISLCAPLPQDDRPAGVLRDALAQEGYTRLLDPGDASATVQDLLELSARRFGALRGRGLLVLDRLAPRGDEDRTRVAEAVERAFARSGQVVALPADEGEALTLQSGFACTACGRRHPTPEPALFSFDSALGACPACQGFGRIPGLDLARVIPDPTKSLRKGAVAPFRAPSARGCQRDLLRACKEAGVPSDVAWRELDDAQRHWVIEGAGDEWYGVRGYFDYLEKRRYKVQARITIARYRRFDPCPSCRGARLREEALAVEVGGRHLGDVGTMTIGELGEWLEGLTLHGDAAARGGRIHEALRARVATTREVGLGYLGLDRALRTLSGGEAQRIQLAAALGGSLTASLYVLDEPSVGLHPRDVERLLGVLAGIRALGNTVVVVEHAPEIVAAADHVIDLGPGAGRHGGQVVAEGSVAEIRECTASETGRALRGEPFGAPRKPRAERGALWVRGAREHNLREIDVRFPLGQLVAVSGVSGAGKTTLVRSVLVGGLGGAPGLEPESGSCDAIEGAEGLADIVLVEPTALGRGPRSNPATVSKAFEGIRKLFAARPEALARDMGPGWFSFNVIGGRCEACEGTGETVIDMQFLEDVRVDCDACGGSRYRDEVLAVRVGGRTIVEVLALSLEEAQQAFASEKRVAARLEPFVRVGLGYLTLGQPLHTLSGGELQRLRLAAALAEGRPGSLYVFDEPTTGLHPAEVQTLIRCLDALLDAGSSVVVVEHNLELIAQADHLIELGPEGGPGGGQLVASGTPAEVASLGATATGLALRRR